MTFLKKKTSHFFVQKNRFLFYSIILLLLNPTFHLFLCFKMLYINRTNSICVHNGIADVISNCHYLPEGHAQFTPVPIKPLSDVENIFLYLAEYC